jgi:hypothetical protein
MNGCCSNRYSNDGRMKCTPGGCGGGSGGGSGGGGGGGGSSAYVTYHNYGNNDPFIPGPSCSDGQYGLVTRWGYSTLAPLAPYVMATSISGWNSPNCGKCYEVSGPAGTRYITAIDQCAPDVGGGMHFDIHPQAFREVMGDAGVFAGSGRANFREVASSNCKGNRG